MNYIENKSIVLFDGICNLCDSSVRFIIKNDPSEHFSFASLQSDAAKEILLQLTRQKFLNDSIILIEEGNIHVESTAVLKIMRKLNYPSRLVYCFIVFPRWIRDPIYRFIARNRYQWFGRKNECMVPEKNIKSRFIDLL